MPSIPPSLGKTVTYRTFSWEMLCAKAWGPAFKQPDHGIYDFDGRRFDSTDQYRSGVYGAVPNVSTPVLTATGFANGVQLDWTAATIAGSSIAAYILFRSTDNLNYGQLAVVQGTALDYFDAFEIENVADVTDASANQIIDLNARNIVFLISGAPSGVSYYVIAESALGSMSAPSNIATVNP